MAANFGVSNDLAIFYTADKIPTLIYTVLIVGAISTIFIPIFTSLLKKDTEKAFKVAFSIITATFIIFGILGFFVFIFSEEIMKVLAVGTFSYKEIKLGSNLIRIMTGAQFFLIAGSLVTSILQSFKYFLIPALAPIFYNLGIIIGALYFVPIWGILGLAYGVVLGAFSHLLVQEFMLP